MEIFEMEKEFNDLMKAGQELIKKLKEDKVTDDSKKVKRWEPKKIDDYYVILADGNIDCRIWDNDIVDNNCFRLGNCFKTKEEAQKELDRRIAERELLDLCDWNGEEQVRVIIYDVKTKKFDWNWFYEITSPYRFASKESCQKAIDTLGEERLKLIFRIED